MPLFESSSQFRIDNSNFTDVAGDSSTLSISGQQVHSGISANAGRDAHTIINYNYVSTSNRRDKPPSVSLARRILLRFATPPPTIVTVGNVALQPDPPEGLKYVCFTGPDTFDSPPPDQYPVLKYAGYTYWALSFVDNDYAFAILAYDNKGRMVKRVDKRGARYVCRIELEKDMVTFFGQADHSVAFRLRDLAVI